MASVGHLRQAKYDCLLAVAGPLSRRARPWPNEPAARRLPHKWRAYSRAPQTACGVSRSELGRSDANLSDAFLRDLRLPEPAHHLEVGSGSHAEQTGRTAESLTAWLGVHRAIQSVSG